MNIEIFGMAGVPEGAAPGVTVPIGTKCYAWVPVLHIVAPVLEMLDSA